MFDYFIYFMLFLFVGLGVFMVIAKKRMDNNEPIAGWKRKQFLQEQNSNEGIESQENPTIEKNDSKIETIKDLIGVKDIKYGVFEKARNEYSIILSADFVNFDLLNKGEQLSTILGYQSLWKVINFPIQILGQAVRQDFRRDEARFNKNLSTCNPQTRDYNERVIRNIKERTIEDFRISRKVYYVVNYIYEPSKMGKLTPAQRERRIVETLYQQALIIDKMLRRAKINTEILDSLEAMEVMKRALNRDRMLINPIEDVVAEGREKITSFITADPQSLPGFEDLVQDVEEVLELAEHFAS